MNIQFEGFQPLIPGWLIVLIGFLAVGLTIWAYADYSKINKKTALALITLRSSALIILILILLNPSFEQISTELIKPEIVYILDNSSSTAIQKGDYKGVESYRSVLKSLEITDTTAVRNTLFKMDSNVQPVLPDSLSFNGNNTNIFKGIEALDELGRDIRAAVLVSDGIYTKGRDPSFLAVNIDVPVFTIGLGDTAEVKDIVVKNVVTNSTGYTNTRHQVEAEILNQGFTDTDLTVSLLADGQIIDQKNITTSGESSSHSVPFDINLKETGLKQYQIQVSELDGEWTTENNIDNFAIDVLDNKTRVLHISFEIHPDIKTIRQIISRDESYVVKKMDYIGNNTFTGSTSLDGIDTDSLDLFILQGYNPTILNQRTQQQIRDIVAELPVIFVRTPTSQFQNANSAVQQKFPIDINSIQSITPVSLSQSVKKQEHPILELPEINYLNLPLVLAPVRNNTAKPTAQTLFEAYYQNTPTNSPMVVVQETGAARSALFNFYGFYKWQQSNNEEVRAFFETLVFNIVDWTGTRPDNQRLKIIPAQKVFETGSPVLLNAYLNNESGETEPDGVIDISIKKSDTPERFYTMKNIGNGRYTLSLNNLSKGLYSFEATAKKGGRIIDTKKGEFSVSSTNSELIDTKRNELLLRQIAASTNGTYLPFNKSDSLLTILNDKDLLDSKQKTVSTSGFPYQNLYWFLLVIVLLTAEWLYRKYLALP